MTAVSLNVQMVAGQALGDIALNLGGTGVFHTQDTLKGHW
jgi:hypothetical protein